MTARSSCRSAQFGQRVLLATDRGQIRVLELDLNQTGTPIRVAAEALATVKPGTVSYPLLDGGRLWVGDSQLTHYELQTSRGQLVRKWLTNKGDQVLAPLQLRGATLFYVRQRSGKAGVTVAAASVGGSSGSVREGEAIWEVDLGVPPAGEPFVNRAAQEINVVTGNGVLFAVGKEAIRVGLEQTPRQELLDPQLPRLVQLLRLDEQRSAFLPAPGSDRVVLYEASRGARPLSVVTLDLAGQVPSALPVAFDGKLLVATTSGAVHLLDPASGKSAAAPFLPAMGADMTVAWFRPFVLPDGKRAILADERGKLYEVVGKSSPQPHLAEERQQQADAPFVAAPIVLDQTVLGIVRGAGQDVLRRYRLEDLQLQGQLELPGRVLWGPVTVGELGLLMTDQRHLMAFRGAELLFDTDQLDGAVIGSVAEYDGGLVLSTVGGSIWHLARDSGSVLGRVEVGEALGTGPVPFAGNRFIVCAGDGTLHVVPLEANGG